MSVFSTVRRWMLGSRALEQARGEQYPAPSMALVEDSAMVGPDLALQISAVWACVSRRATTVASLPFFAYTSQNGQRTVDRTSRLWSLLHESPNGRMTPYEFWMAMMLNHDLRGNAYARIDRDPRTGEALSLWPMPADQVTPHVLDDGSMVYLYRIDNDVVALAEESVLHLKDLGNGTVGLPRLEYMRATTTESKNAQWQANRVFGSAGKPTGVLMIDHVLKPDQRKALQERFGEMAAGNTARLYLLEANMKYQQLSLSPEDQQLLDSRKFGVEEICRWFDVPPVLIHHSNVTTWGSGIEQIVDGFHKFTVRPMLVSIEQAVRKRVMTPAQRARMSVEFSLDALLRASLKDRMTIYSTAVQNGIKSRNECRQLENDPPYVGGDIFTAQSNLAPVDMLGKIAAPPPPAEPDPTESAKVADFLREQVELRSEAAAQARHTEMMALLRAAKPVAPSVTVNQAPVTVNQAPVSVTTPDVRATFEMTVPEAPPPVVNVQPPAVRNEITVQPAAVKNDITVQPAAVSVTLPARRTDTTVTRDSDGNIVKATQIEKDA